MGVSAACREAGISRTLFYRWQDRLSRYGVDGLHPRRLRGRPGPAPQLLPQLERRLWPWRSPKPRGARHGRSRHVQASRPGGLVCLDTCYLGKLKAVGKVWQITACDAASSYGVVRILPALEIGPIRTKPRHAYSFDRPQYGYRVRGRTPASVLQLALPAVR